MNIQEFWIVSLLCSYLEMVLKHVIMDVWDMEAVDGYDEGEGYS